mmetsp:Transcript_22740/g.48290  ORF Transcript_22740/g.48290 Transcript_22740/m.48290 type:complete len:399 (-) Transcript_22740:267-1463(-)
MLVTPPQSPRHGPSDFAPDGARCQGSSSSSHHPHIEDIATTVHPLLALRAQLTRQAWEARVRARCVEADAMVAMTQHQQEGATERTRLEESGKTKRTQVAAEVASLLANHHGQLQREKTAKQIALCKEAINTWGRVEMHKTNVNATITEVWQLLIGMLVGAVVSTKPSRGIRKAIGHVQWVFALLFLAYIRHLWTSNTMLRNVFLSSGVLGDSLRTLVRSAAATLADATSMTASTFAEGLAMLDGADGKTKAGAEQPFACPLDDDSQWVCKVGPNGRHFYHHLSLGRPPWELHDCESRMFGAGVATEGSTGDTSGCISPQNQENAGQGELTKTTWGGRMGALLSNWGLSQYAQQLEENGYDADALRALTEEETSEMFAAIECKPAHQAMFREALQSWR